MRVKTSHYLWFPDLGLESGLAQMTAYIAVEPSHLRRGHCKRLISGHDYCRTDARCYEVRIAFGAGSVLLLDAGSQDFCNLLVTISQSPV